jgi:hypothetical protein
MKRFWTLVVLFTLFTSTTHSQILGSFFTSPAFNDSLSKIVVDFKNNFSKIQGDALPTQGGIDTYESIVTLPGSIQNYVYRSHSTIDTTASWQAIMYKGDSYEKAMKVYKNTFHQVKNSRIKLSDRSTAHFSGKLAREKDVSFVVSRLYIDISDPIYRKFVAEVEFIGNFMAYEVHLNLFNRKTDEDLTPND